MCCFQHLTMNMRLHWGSFKVASIMNSSTVCDGCLVKNLIKGSLNGLPAYWEREKWERDLEKKSKEMSWNNKSIDWYVLKKCFEQWLCTSMSMALSVFMTTSNKGFTRVWGAAGIRWKRLMMAEQIFISWTESEKRNGGKQLSQQKS